MKIIIITTIAAQCRSISKFVKPPLIVVVDMVRLSYSDRAEAATPNSYKLEVDFKGIMSKFDALRKVLNFIEGFP
jgi:cobyrinic acid a,c-diamide synthase